MKTGNHDGGPGSLREDFRLDPSDGDQPAGRIMALALADQLGDIASYSVESTRDSARRSKRLHRYRLALRRTKTVLIAGGTVFPGELASSALEAVSAELHRTAELRNLDVLAESLRSWQEYLSPEMHGGLRKITAAVDERCDAGYIQVSELIESVGHAAMLERLRSLATVYRLGGEEPGPDVLVKARTVARASFNEAWARVEVAGKTAIGSDDVEDWHRLRRRLKRARYLTDAFAPILTNPDETSYVDGVNTQEAQAKELAKAAKRIRKLLNELGELQDLAVEAELLKELGAQMGTKATMAAGAMLNPVQLEMPTQIRRSRKRWKKLRHFSLG